MIIIEEGYKYELEYFDKNKSIGQALIFVNRQKMPDEHTPSEGNTVTVKEGEIKVISDGTTEEDVILVLIDRLNFFQKTNPSPERSLSIIKLEESLMWLKKGEAGGK